MSKIVTQETRTLSPPREARLRWQRIDVLRKLLGKNRTKVLPEKLRYIAQFRKGRSDAELNAEFEKLSAEEVANVKSCKHQEIIIGICPKDSVSGKFKKGQELRTCCSCGTIR